MMTEDDIRWFEDCRDFAAQYTMVVDNDKVYVIDNADGEQVYTFSECGWQFALGLLRYMGCKAEKV